MMSSSSELPWVPVTIAKALDWRERDDIAKMRADEARVHAKSNDAVAGTRAEFDAYRASFSAAQLRDPGRIKEMKQVDGWRVVAGQVGIEKAL